MSNPNKITSKITTAEIENIARLARITLDSNEQAQLHKKLESVLDYFSILDEIDSEELAEFNHFPDADNVLRIDASLDTITTEQALSNAPARDGDFFQTPLIIETE